MRVFRPPEIRVIILLSLIALTGSILSLLKRQGRISSLDLGVFTEKGNYKYEYEFPEFDDPVSIDSATIKPALPEISSDGFPIDINKAGYYDLQILPGIGPAIARNIVAYRDSVGRFSKIEDLLAVDGIGPAKLTAIKDKVTLK